jgi:3-deoxy-D-manno-octulosonate 8-phosphate phosphatase (KDO 8-P phosphatase)
MSLYEKALEIKALVLDVDGVLTDGRIGYGCGSSAEIKFFNVKDGHGIKLAMRAGLQVGILSGRASEANRARAAELKLDFVYENVKDKLAGFKLLLSERGLQAKEVLYVGDDLIDMPPMRECGVAVAVADAVPELDSVAALRTKAKGGEGAVREVVEWILKEQGKWNSVVSRYYA